MKKIILMFVLLFTLGVFYQINAAGFKYVGAKKCKMCHSSSKSGAQYKKWEKAPHSKAYKTLASAESKKIAKKKGIKDAQKSPKCLRCHSTVYDITGKKRKNVDSTLKVTEGVSCESCHGPGSVYKSKKNMVDHKKFIAFGGIMATKMLCESCHNEESPTYKPFDFNKKKIKIAHPTPKKK